MKNTDHKEEYSHVVKYTGIFAGVQVISILVGLIRNKLVALILGPAGMGLITLFQSTIRMVSEITGLGIPTSAVRDVSAAYEEGDERRLHDKVRVIRTWSVIAAVLGMVICAVLSPWLNAWTFNWGNHTLHFVLLSPVVAVMALAGGEMAVLKATRQLRALARVSIYHVIMALIITVPIYFFFGESGIVPSIFLLAFVQMVLAMIFSYRRIPLSLSFSKKTIGQGAGMIRLGLGLVAAVSLGYISEFFIRSFLNTAGTLETVGLYNAGYMLAIVYSSLVFAAMETDYFPRLSAVKEAGPDLNQVVNRQIEVSILLISPMLVAMMVFMPIIIPLLYSPKFNAVIPMVQIILLALYFRAVKLPVQYIPLARGDSFFYFIMEAVYAIGLVVLTILGFNRYGLWGAGLAITVMSVFDFIFLNVCIGIKYKYRLSAPVVKYAAVQIGLGGLTYAATFIGNCYLYYAVGVVLAAISAWYSVKVLKSKTHLWEALKAKIWRKKS